MNALRLAAVKDIRTLIRKRYDLIYSTGLFDYFNDKISIKLISNLKKLLLPDGMIMISNVTDRYKNPSVHYMEWAGQWVLVYRTAEEFKRIFIEAGFDKEKLMLIKERTGVMQYIKASL
jgi:cyclopropane fatty-acyl-phospholipid synthase-like methyltransferase